jgi:hypothetical protein
MSRNEYGVGHCNKDLRENANLNHCPLSHRQKTMIASGCPFILHSRVEILHEEEPYNQS